MYRKKGFTLIELLIVIAIIGVLATIIVASLSNARDRSRVASTQLELRELQRIFFEYQIVTDTTIRDTTGRNCSDCSCRNIADISALPESHICIQRWRSAIDRIAEAIDNDIDSTRYYEDAWGAPYLLDENEGEVVAELGCRADIIRSAGPDSSVGPLTRFDPTFVGTPADEDDVELELFTLANCE